MRQVVNQSIQNLGYQINGEHEIRNTQPEQWNA